MDVSHVRLDRRRDPHDRIGLVVHGRARGYFQALDARTGALLWKSSLGSTQIFAAPITYQVDGKQFVSIIAGNVLAAYAIRD